MADPLSVIAGTIGLLEVSWRFGKYLKDLHDGAATVESEISALSHEIELLIKVNISLQEICKMDREENLKNSLLGSKLATNVLEDTIEILYGCRKVIEKMEKLVHDVFGKGHPKIKGKFDSIMKQFKKSLKEGEFNQYRLQLSNYQSSLQLSLTALNLSLNRATFDSTGHLSEDVQMLGFKLQFQIASLRSQLGPLVGTNVHKSILSATEIASQLPLNKHFDLPRPVSSMFTGRENLLERLGDALFSQEVRRGQRRFVIFGLGGSGKTEFCCKFAQDHQQRFWGVFWVDATSHDTIRHTFTRIAKFGGLEPNMRSARNWLSSLNSPWLLIIENANESHIPLEDCYPEGERGCILITTRNPNNKIHGTVGSKFFHFEKMEADEANELLLKAADEPSPWTIAAYNSASIIAKALGYLPLALIHAGKAIMGNLCSLSNYLDYYNRSWQRIRKARNLVDFQGHEDSNMNVYSSYEIIYLGLEAKGTQTSKDAIDLLKIFSFLNWENIQFNLLMAAAQNPKREQQARIKEARAEHTPIVNRKPLTLSQILKNLNLGLRASILGDRTPPVLPNVLRNFDEDRLRLALLVLTQLSLITSHGSSNNYSMHPLIHTWIRERPQISTAEQAIWCYAAATTISQCVLLPPLGTTEADIQIRLELLPHVIHVRKCQEEIDARIEENRSQAKISWLPRMGHTLARQRLEASQSARFSIVYSQSGIWDIAERLQRQVMDFVINILGTEHPICIDIMLALSFTYQQQTRANEAIKLQQDALKACIHLYGLEHQKTLKVMEMLATSCTNAGRLHQALELYETVIEKLTATLGADHEETVLAMDSLGRLMMMYMRYEDARVLHERAVAVLTRILGPTHLKTLIAMESLAMANLAIGGDLIRPAHDIMIQVLEERKRKLGKEQPYTLLAICNLARIKSALDDTKEAENLMRSTLPIAIQNLDKDHFGTLMGEAHLAKVLERQKRYDEAETMLVEVVKPKRYAKSARDDGEHPDRIGHLYMLMQCYEVQEKYDDTLRVGKELLNAIDSCGGQGLGKNHILYKRVLEKIAKLHQVQEEAVREDNLIDVK